LLTPQRLLRVPHQLVDELRQTVLLLKDHPGEIEKKLFAERWRQYTDTPTRLPQNTPHPMRQSRSCSCENTMTFAKEKNNLSLTVYFYDVFV